MVAIIKRRDGTTEVRQTFSDRLRKARQRRQALDAQKRARTEKRKAESRKQKVERFLFRKGIPTQAEVKGGVGSDITTTKFIEVDGKRFDIEKIVRGGQRRGVQRQASRTVERKELGLQTSTSKILSDLPSFRTSRGVVLPKEKPLSLLQKAGRGISRAEKFVSKKIGSGKIAERTLKRKKASLVRLEQKVKRLEQKPDKSFLEKAKLKVLKFDVRGRKTVGAVGDVVVSDVLRNPIKNTALLASGAGLGRGVQLAGLKIAKISSASTKLGKTLGVSSKVAGGALTTAYVSSVALQANDEFLKTGKVTNTTANTIREILLFGGGAKLGSSKKLSTITQLQKDINKLPKAQRVKLQKQINKVSKLSEKALNKKSIGIVTRLEAQQITKNIKSKGSRGVLKEDVVTVTNNNIFVVKKGSVPKKKKLIDLEVIGVKRVGKKGLAVTQTIKSNVRAVINPKTGKVDIREVVSAKPISQSEARSLITRFDVSKKFQILKKPVSVRGFERRVKTGVEIKPKIIIKRKKIIKTFEVTPITKAQTVKGFVRKDKRLVSISLKKSSKRLKFDSPDGETAFIFNQFKPISIQKTKKPTTSKAKPKKTSRKGLKDEKLVIKQKVKPKKPRKPVVKVKTVSVKGQKLRIIPLPRTKKQKTEVLTIRETQKIIKPVIKPVIKVLSKTKRIAKTQPIIKTLFKPVLDIIPTQKPRRKSKALIKAKVVKALKPKTLKKPVLQAKRVLKTRFRTVTKPKSIKKPKIRIFKIKKKPKKVSASKEAKKIKSLSFDFTPTAVSPTKKTKFKKKKGELVFFTGLELRG